MAQGLARNVPNVINCIAQNHAAAAPDQIVSDTCCLTNDVARGHFMEIASRKHVKEDTGETDACCSAKTRPHARKISAARPTLPICRLAPIRLTLAPEFGSASKWTSAAPRWDSVTNPFCQFGLGSNVLELPPFFANDLECSSIAVTRKLRDAPPTSVRGEHVKR